MSEHEFTMPFSIAADVPHLSDYFGIWNVYAPAFQTLADKANGINLHAHIQATRDRRQLEPMEPDTYELTKDGCALIQVRGPMMKASNSMGAGGTVNMRTQLADAKRDPAVKCAMLIFDTPGGTAKGNADFAQSVRSFAAVKPCMAFVEDMCASAGVAIASQCPMRVANQPASLYGAMGTYSVLSDSSGMAEKLGVKVHVIRAGQYKGAGEPGTEITPDQLAEAQRVVNLINEEYLSIVAQGCGLSLEHVRSLADGRIHSAADAVGMGLLTGIATFDDAYSQLLAACSPGAMKGAGKMATEKQAATLGELKQRFPKSSADWREKQMEAGATIEQAAVSYAEHVEAQAEAREKELQKQVDDARSEKAKAQGNSSLGHRPLKTQEAEQDADSGDPVEDFNGEVAKRMGRSQGLNARFAAIRAVAKAKPELYRAYLQATNASGTPSQKRLLAEKLDGEEQYRASKS